MSTTYAGPLARIGDGLDELAAISPEFRSTSEKKELLVGLAQLIARAEAELMRVLATSEDIAAETGDRSRLVRSPPQDPWSKGGKTRLQDDSSAPSTTTAQSRGLQPGRVEPIRGYLLRLTDFAEEARGA